MRNLLLLIALFSLSACCGIPQKAKLDLPDDVVLPELTNQELSCVTQETYEKIADMKIACEEGIKTHRDVIKSTH